MASSISTVAVDFVANVAKYMSGLDTMATKTKSWSDKTKKDTQGATDAFDGTSKAINNLAKQLIALVAIEKVGAAFANAAKQVSQLADEAEKVGASAKQVDKLRLAAERNGTNIDTVKIAYKELQKSTNEALNGTKSTIKAFDELGVSFNYIARLNPDDKFKAITKALSEVQDANKRAELGTILLGKAYTELSPLIAKGQAGIATGGRGALSESQIQSIDKVTKAFEEVGRALDIQLRKALVALAPALTIVANALTSIIENFNLIIAGAALAFSPIIITKFAGAISTVVQALLNYVIVVKNAQAAAAALGGVDLFANWKNFGPLIASSGIPEILLKIRLAAIALIPPLGTVAGLLKTVGASLATFAVSYIGTLAVIGKGAEILGFNIFAKQSYEAIDSAKEFSKGLVGIETNATKAAKAQQDLIEQLKLTEQTDADKALDAIARAAEEAKKASDDYVKSLIDLGKTLDEQFGNPLDIAEAKLVKYTNAVDLGTMSFEVYKKAVADVLSKLSEVDRFKIREKFGTGPFEALAAPLGDKAGPNDPRGLIGSSRKPLENFIPDFTRGSSTLLVNLKNINTAVGGVADSYNTAGENLLKFTIASDKAFSDSKLKTFSSLKSEIDLQAVREKAIKMGPELYDATRKESEVLQKRVLDIQTAASATDIYGKKIIDVEVASRALAQAQADLFAATTPYWENIVGFTKNFADGLASAIVAGQSFGDALKNVFQDVLKQIAILIIRTTILQAIMASIGLASAPAALAFGQMTGIVGKASGGPVTGGMPYKVGEAGPEMFVPSQNGVIMPNGMTGGSQTPIVQNIYIQTGVSQTVRAEMAALLPTFKQQAIAGVAEAKQRGGSYARALSAA